MYFDSVQAALEMDGHGGFVWAAYAICLFVLAMLLLAPRRRRQKFLRALAGELKRQQRGPTAVEEND